MKKKDGLSLMVIAGMPKPKGKGKMKMEKEMCPECEGEGCIDCMGLEDDAEDTGSEDSMDMEEIDDLDGMDMEDDSESEEPASIDAVIQAVKDEDGMALEEALKSLFEKWMSEREQLLTAEVAL